MEPPRLDNAFPAPDTAPVKVDPLLLAPQPPAFAITNTILMLPWIKLERSRYIALVDELTTVNNGDVANGPVFGLGEGQWVFGDGTVGVLVYGWWIGINVINIHHYNIQFVSSNVPPQRMG